MRKPVIWFWGFWVLVGLGVEFWGIARTAPDDTFSEFTWYLVRGQTIGGFVFLTGLLVFLAWWYPKHIRELKGKKKAPLFVVGGSVRTGQPYIIGEKRPETFIPTQPGTIVPPFGRIDREDH